MDLFDILSLIGGIAFFLYGMHVMGDGLSAASGGRMEKFLEKTTSNRFKAVALGALVTAAIQSSAATIVTVVGFVNSGIMQLTQAVGVIMGANIGTTITAWILSLAGIQSDNVFIMLLKPTSFTPIFAIIGAILLTFSKNEKKKLVGTILLGFSVLMFGMNMMSEAVEPLKDVPQFTSLLVMFSNPILGMIVGAIVTFVVQSSSVSVGILQALCNTGSLTYATALPIIMGQNIGTCFTAMLSAIGAKKNAKRAALIHLYFNLIGTILFMVAFYALHAVLKFAFVGEQANAAGIAKVHSAFNIAATLALLPFSNLLVKLANLTVKDEEGSNEEIDKHDELRLLDSRFLNKPGVAIEQCKTATDGMSELAQTAIVKAMSLLDNYDQEIADQVAEIEDKVDKYQDAIGSYLVKLPSHNLTKEESHMLSVLLHTIGDFERMSDHALNIMESAKEMHDKKQFFSEDAKKELAIFNNALKDVISLTGEVFHDFDIKRAIEVEPLEEEIDYLQTELKRRHVERLRSGKCTIEMGFILSDVLTSYERIADHCSNVAVCLLEVNDDQFDTHDYMNKLKMSNDKTFERLYNENKQKYRLPEKTADEMSDE